MTFYLMFTDDTDEMQLTVQKSYQTHEFINKVVILIFLMPLALTTKNLCMKHAVRKMIIMCHLEVTE